jgi:hypothetical protein
VGGRDYEFLWSFEFTGGIVENVALTAAFLLPTTTATWKCVTLSGRCGAT